MINIKFELSDFTNDDPIDNPKVIVEDTGILSSTVKITIGDKSAVVKISELERALSSCRMISPF